MRGGARKPEAIPSKDMTCEVHGRTEHRLYGSRGGQGWRCVMCTNARQAAYAQAVKDGKPVTPANDRANRNPENCEHRWQLDEDQSQDWCAAWTCTKCGTTTITLPGNRPTA